MLARSCDAVHGSLLITVGGARVQEVQIHGPLCLRTDVEALCVAARHSG